MEGKSKQWVNIYMQEDVKRNVSGGLLTNRILAILNEWINEMTDFSKII
jgi:hypothetical protein